MGGFLRPGEGLNDDGGQRHLDVINEIQSHDRVIVSGDFRSDTVTLPCAGMRQAMASAVVGDDCYGDDVTVRALEDSFAELIGKDRSVFFPTGTQSNLAAILTHCQRGEAMLVGQDYHSYAIECGGASALGSVAYWPLPVADDGGLDPDVITMAGVSASRNAPRPALICLENTHGGKAVPLERIKATAKRAREQSLAVHLDGARLFNAALELGVDIGAMAAFADTVSICLSKGLGAPAGTLLACPVEIESSIRWYRKMLGGGMRQSGVLAAAGLYALEHNVERLLEDHRRARHLAERIRANPALANVDIAQHTNMVFVRPAPEDHAGLCDAIAAAGLVIARRIPTLRLVVHLGIDDQAITVLADAIGEFYQRRH
ncbi:MAG: low-specificity L-threonine aldolase [Rhodobacteraceae bacterium]|nr:low-specificity L-threonine aldolase [Paracoccaceae bacterium]